MKHSRNYSVALLSTLAFALNLVSFNLSKSALATEIFSTSDLSAFTKECAVQPYSLNSVGNMVYSRIESRCPEKLKIDEATAAFTLNGEKFVATIEDSIFADDGDLNDLTIKNEEGRVVYSQKTILAFGDVVRAMRGGSDSLELIQK